MFYILQGDMNNFALIVEPVESIVTQCSQQITKHHSITMDNVGE